MRKMAPLVLGVLVLPAACAGRTPGEPMAFATVERGAASGIREPSQIVVRASREWVLVWARHARSVGTVVAPPVDFSREMVVGVFMGERETGGYRIEISGIERTESGIRVRYVTRAPEPGAVLTQALTQPFHLIRLARDERPVTFLREEPAR